MVESRHFAVRAGLVAGVASVALMAGAAHAQNAADSEQSADAPSVTTNEIIVTATKRNDRLADVPMGVTVISGEELEKRQVRSFQDLTAFVPGLSIQTSSPVVTRLILRGLNAGGSGSTVATYVDDSPVGSSNALLQGALLTANLDTFDMAAIEVLKGPQGTLYGANSQGGLIKYVTNAPDTGAFSARAQGEINSIDGGEVGYALRGIINAPLGDRAAIRGSGFYEKLPGFIDDTNLDIEDVNSGKRYGGRLSLLLEPTETLTARITGFYQRLETRADPNVDVVGSPNTYGRPGPDIFKPSAGDLEQRRYLLATRSNDFYNIGGEIDWDLGGVTLESITSYSRAVNRQTTDGGSGAAGFFPPVSPEAPLGVPVGANFFLTNFVFGQPTLFRGQEFFRLTKVTQELRLQSQGEGFLGWQLGGFFTAENTFSSQDQQFVDVATGNVITAAPGPGGEFTIDARYTEFAGFGEIDLRFSPRFEINAGVRYATNDQRANLGVGNGLLGIPAGLPPFRITINTDEDAFTFSVSPKFKINDDTLLYARVASGFRPGGPNLVPPGAPADYPLGYESDSTMNYEIGFRTTLPDRSLSLDIAAFRIDWEDIQIVTLTQVGPSLIGVTGNGGKARSEGVEFSVTARPSERWTFAVNGAYTEAELTEDAPGIGGLAGDRLAYVPEFTLTLDGEYTVPLGENATGFIGFTGAYVGERFTDFGTSITNTPHIPLPDYTTLALRAGADFGSIRVEAYARNVTDTRGIFTYANSGVGAPTITGTKSIIQPRTFGLVVTSSF